MQAFRGATEQILKYRSQAEVQADHQAISAHLAQLPAADLAQLVSTEAATLREAWRLESGRRSTKGPADQVLVYSFGEEMYRKVRASALTPFSYDELRKLRSQAEVQADHQAIPAHLAQLPAADLAQLVSTGAATLREG